MTTGNIGFLVPAVLDEQFADEKAYWREKLSGNLVVSGLPLDVGRPEARNAGETEHVEFAIERSVALDVMRIANANPTLAFAILVTAVKLCLHKYSGHEDIVVGTPVHNTYRDAAAYNKLLVLRDRIVGPLSLRQVLGNVKQTLSEAYAHQGYPFDRILDLLGVEYPDNRTPLFNVLVALDATNDLESIAGMKNDVTVRFSIEGDAITGVVEYAPDVLAEPTIAGFCEHYQSVLRTLTQQPDAPVSDVTLLSEQKKRDLLFEVNATRQDYPRDVTIHALFEAQARATPYEVAATFDGRRLTYQELDARANRMARFLRSLDVGPGTRVGIYLEHSLETLIALFGILKAGATYVPLDPAYPPARLAFMIEDAQISVVLTQQHLVDELPADTPQIVPVDSHWEEIAKARAAAPDSEAGADDLAYVMYTSGSTGTPKGVKISHRALVNYVWWARDVYLDDEPLDFPLYSSLAFDLTVTSIYVPLVTGGRVVIYRKNGRTPALGNILRDNQVDVLKLTPSHLALIEDSYIDAATCRLKRLIVGGEALTSKLAQRTYRRFGGTVEIFNEYGPTEATVGCMLHRFDPETDVRAYVPIGRPAANVHIYILDDELRPVAENVPGELYIAGDGLAEGYLHREGLTRETFVENPFDEGQKMYRTGDLARWLPEGIAEYTGRRDDQVKFHGYRVELNGIRSELNKHPHIRDSIVVVRTDANGQDILVAYYASRKALDSRALHDFLAKHMIEATIPNVFVHVQKLPLTLNGKINYAALPAPELDREALETTYVAPRTDTEQRIVDIWQEVLPVNRVGIRDNFFDLGGHSLLILRVCNKLNAAFDRDVPQVKMFEHPTVGAMADYLDGADDGEAAHAGRERASTRAQFAERRQRARRRRRAARNLAGTQHDE